MFGGGLIHIKKKHQNCHQKIVTFQVCNSLQLNIPGNKYTGDNFPSEKVGSLRGGQWKSSCVKFRPPYIFFKELLLNNKNLLKKKMQKKEGAQKSVSESCFLF